jgi:hypothetical protein
MNGLGSVFNLLAYLAAAIFVLGFLNKVILYFKTPSPLKIATTPAPKTSIGVIVRQLQEVLFFRSLLKGGPAEKMGFSCIFFIDCFKTSEIFYLSCSGVYHVFPADRDMGRTRISHCPVDSHNQKIYE